MPGTGLEVGTSSMVLTGQAVKELRRSLENWRTPAEMQEVCTGLRHRISGLTLFNQGGLTFIMEAIVAADCAVARAATFVRLVPEVEQRPDFELDFEGRIERFEMVQADKKGRRRGDEYKAKAQLPPNTMPRLESPLPEEVIAMVRTAACKKAKPYPPETQLMIYLEAPKFPSDDELFPRFAEAVNDARPFFSAIWISWQGHPYKITSAK